MLNRYWLVIYVFVIACAFGVFWSFEHFLLYLDQQAEERISFRMLEPRVSSQGKIACGVIMSVSGFIDWLSCFVDNLTSTRSGKASEYELRAQQDMAAWGLGMLYVNIWLTVSTLVGVVFVGSTLFATQKMASDTNKQVEISRKAEEARARREGLASRPRLEPTLLAQKLEFLDGQAKLTVSISLLARGPYQAEDVKVSTKCFLLDRESPDQVAITLPSFDALEKLGEFGIIVQSDDLGSATKPFELTIIDREHDYTGKYVKHGSMAALIMLDYTWGDKSMRATKIWRFDVGIYNGGYEPKILDGTFSLDDTAYVQLISAKHYDSIE